MLQRLETRRLVGAACPGNRLLHVNLVLRTARKINKRSKYLALQLRPTPLPLTVPILVLHPSLQRLCPPVRTLETGHLSFDGLHRVTSLSSEPVQLMFFSDRQAAIEVWSGGTELLRNVATTSLLVLTVTVHRSEQKQSFFEPLIEVHGIRRLKNASLKSLVMLLRGLASR